MNTYTDDVPPIPEDALVELVEVARYTAPGGWTTLVALATFVTLRHQKPRVRFYLWSPNSRAWRFSEHDQRAIAAVLPALAEALL